MFCYKERTENHSFSPINDGDIVDAMKIKKPNTNKKRRIYVIPYIGKTFHPTKRNLIELYIVRCSFSRAII